MSLRAFLALVLTTVLAVAAVVVMFTTQNTGPAAREPGTVMLPEMARQDANIARIVATRGGEQTTIKRVDGLGKPSRDAQWVVEELSNYPSFALLVSDVITGVTNLQTIEGKTLRPDLYSKLAVEPPTASDARSTRLEFFTADNKKIGDIILGRTKSAMAGQESLYVRRPDEDRAWLAKGKAEAPTGKIGWVNNEVLVVDLPRIRSATLNTPAKGPRVHVFKTSRDERDFTIEGMPDDHEVKDIFGAEDVARVVQQLSFEDVRPADKFKIDTTAKPWAEFVTFDGLKIDLWLQEADGKNWVALRASAVPAEPAAAPPPSPAPAPAPEATAAPDGAPSPEAAAEPAEKPRDVAEEIKTINERVTPWVYAIPSYENGNLRKTLDDLIEKKPDDKAAPDSKAN